MPGMRLAGGLLIRIEPFGDYPTGNLTSDKETGLGNWTDDEIKRVLTRGILRDGTRLLPYPMDWPSYLDDDAGRSERDRRLPAHGAADLQQSAAPHAHVPAALPLGQVQDADPRRRSADDLLPRQRRHQGGTPLKRVPQVDASIVVVLAGGRAGFLRVPVFHPAVLHRVAGDVFEGRSPTQPPAVDGIADPAERAIAERGRYIVDDAPAASAATRPTERRDPTYTKYLAGGGLKVRNARTARSSAAT